jgi:hypothetical protein
LTAVTIPNSVITIGDQAFASCYKLTNATIPESVTSIGGQAFYGCISLTKVAIPNGVTSIGLGTFESCYGLTNVAIGTSVTNVADWAFAWCYNLSSIHVAGNAPSAGSNAFYYAGIWTTGVTTIYYLPGTTGWGMTFAGLPTAIWQPLVQASDGSFGVRTNQFGFNISWASGQVVVVEACTNLANPIWSSLQTNILASDTLYFSDPQWTNYAGRFYRFRSP